MMNIEDEGLLNRQLNMICHSGLRAGIQSPLERGLRGVFPISLLKGCYENSFSTPLYSRTPFSSPFHKVGKRGI